MRKIRVFNDLPVSEQVALLAEEYSVKRTTEERERIGQEYGMTGRNIARYIRCNKLIPAFKDMLDDGTLTIMAGVELSYLSENEQEAVLSVVETNCVDIKADEAKRLRAAAGTVTAATAQTLLGVDKPVVTTARGSVSIKLPATVYRRFFSDVAAKDVQGIVEAALDRYYERNGA